MFAWLKFEPSVHRLQSRVARRAPASTGVAMSDTRARRIAHCDACASQIGRGDSGGGKGCPCGARVAFGKDSPVYIVTREAGRALSSDPKVLGAHQVADRLQLGTVRNADEIACGAMVPVVGGEDAREPCCNAPPEPNFLKQRATKFLEEIRFELAGRGHAPLKPFWSRQIRWASLKL